MYCSHCGAQIPEDSAFCQKCGKKQGRIEEPVAQTTGQLTKQTGGLHREALLLYLQDVRDLEVSLYYLQQKYQQEKQNHIYQIDKLRETSFQALPHKPEKGGSIAKAVAAAVAAVFVLWIIIWLFQSPPKFLSIYAGIISSVVRFVYWAAIIVCIIICVVAIVTVITSIASVIGDHSEYGQKYKDVLSHNDFEKKKEEQNKLKISSLNQNWNQREAWYQEEKNKIVPILNDFYNMNLIPKQFRNVSAICYIYDYMSTSQESLTMALLDQHLEDGIRRIENKLDEVIAQMADMVYETRCLRQESQRAVEQNNRIIEQNNRMLDSLQRTEQNTLQAAQYSELSANNTRATAYLSLATYLKN